MRGTRKSAAKAVRHLCQDNLRQEHLLLGGRQRSRKGDQLLASLLGEATAVLALRLAWGWIVSIWQIADNILSRRRCHPLARRLLGAADAQ